MPRLLFLAACLLTGAGLPLLVFGMATGRVPVALGLPGLPAAVVVGMLLSAPYVLGGGGHPRDLDLQIRASGDAVKVLVLVRVALWLGRQVLVAAWVVVLWLTAAIAAAR